MNAKKSSMKVENETNGTDDTQYDRIMIENFEIEDSPLAEAGEKTDVPCQLTSAEA